MPPLTTFPRSAAFLVAAILFALLGLDSPVVHAAQAAHAAPPTLNYGADPQWAELNATQRKVLEPLSGDWDQLDDRSKERWLDVASRFHRMPLDEQGRATQRMVEWSHMTAAQRVQARMNFQESRSVSKEEREARWKAYQALPEEKKRELARRASAAASVASAGVAAAKRRPASSTEDASLEAGAADSAASRPVAPAQVRTGATTSLLTRRANPPAHQRDGQPKIAAGPGYVDRTTLLPKRGPQATVSAAATSSAPRP